MQLFYFPTRRAEKMQLSPRGRFQHFVYNFNQLHVSAFSIQLCWRAGSLCKKKGRNHDEESWCIPTQGSRVLIVQRICWDPFSDVSKPIFCNHKLQNIFFAAFSRSIRLAHSLFANWIPTSARLGIPTSAHPHSTFPDFPSLSETFGAFSWNFVGIAGNSR